MGCATGSEIAVPSSLLECRESPAVPVKGTGAKAAANYVVDLYEAHEDCFDKLGEVRGLVKPLTK